MTGRSSDTCNIHQAALRFGLVYWGAVFVFLGVLWGVVGSGPVGAGVSKALLYASCPVVATLMSALLLRLHERSSSGSSSEKALPVLIGTAFILSAVVAPVWAALGHAASVIYLLPQPAVLDWKEFGYDTAYGASLFFGWACLFITLVFGFELNARACRLAAVREEALAAQMRALRYQVNPHFLFNTLNSVAGLIEEEDTSRAKQMIFSLSTFLRTTLVLDPMHDVSLADELTLQEEYLAIERERFPDRMTFSINVPEDLRHALVPSLILQPLIENAIKHGVSLSVDKVEIALMAYRNADRFCVVVENDMPVKVGDERGSSGFGVGLRNVGDRLRACFNEEGLLSAGAISPSRYRASIDLPWRAQN